MKGKGPVWRERLGSQGGSQEFRGQIAKRPALEASAPLELTDDGGVQVDHRTRHSSLTGKEGEAIFASKVTIESTRACCAAATTIASEIRRAETPCVQ